MKIGDTVIYNKQKSAGGWRECMLGKVSYPLSCECKLGMSLLITIHSGEMPDCKVCQSQEIGVKGLKMQREETN